MSRWHLLDEAAPVRSHPGAATSSRLWAELDRAHHPPRAVDLALLPEPVRRWQASAVRPGAPRAASVTLEMSGLIKVGRWLPFRASQLIVAGRGFMWAARAGWRLLSIKGFDYYGESGGQLRWSVDGRIPVLKADGDDVTRSAAWRFAGESLAWLPSAIADVSWLDAGRPDAVIAVRRVGAYDQSVELRIGADGRLLSADGPRWGNPDGLCWAEYPFGVTFSAHETFHGFTVPTALSAGWWSGTDRADDGEFFRAQITDAVYS